MESSSRWGPHTRVWNPRRQNAAGIRLRMTPRSIWCARSALAHKVHRCRWITGTWTGQSARRSCVPTQIRASKLSQHGFRHSPHAILPATTTEFSTWLPPSAALCSPPARQQPSRPHHLLRFFLHRRLRLRRLPSGLHRRRLRSRRHRRPWLPRHRHHRRAASAQYAELCTR